MKSIGFPELLVLIGLIVMVVSIYKFLKWLKS